MALYNRLHCTNALYNLRRVHAFVLHINIDTERIPSALIHSSGLRTLFCRCECSYFRLCHINYMLINCYASLLCIVLSGLVSSTPIHTQILIGTQSFNEMLHTLCEFIVKSFYHNLALCFPYAPPLYPPLCFAYLLSFSFLLCVGLLPEIFTPTHKLPFADYVTSA